MERRPFLKAAARLLVAATASSAATVVRSQPSHTVSKQQLQRAIALRFPRRYPVAGWLDVTAEAPTLQLLAPENRLGAQLTLTVEGPMMASGYPGTLDFDFALRYQASDRTVRAHQLRVNAVRFENLPPQASALLSLYGPVLAEQSLQGAVLHQLQPPDLALPDSMGLQPDTITVTSKGLLIAFVAKAPA